MKINILYHITHHRRITVSLAVALITVLTLVGGALSSCSQTVNPSLTPEQFPRLIVDDSVAGDFRKLAVETWGKFLTVFEARLACFGDVRLHATRILNSRAVYDPDTATVTVRVPATAAILEEALVHEWAHHLEFQCEAQQELRPAFLAAQGLPPETRWWPDDLPPNQIPQSAWADIPSEMYAEAVIEVVLGSRQVATGVKLSREAVQVVREWTWGK